MIGNEDLDKWARLANAATEGPWHVCGADVCTMNVKDNKCSTNCAHYAISTVNGKDCAFIAAARKAVPALIARVRELEDELKEEKKRNERLLWRSA